VGDLNICSVDQERIDYFLHIPFPAFDPISSPMRKFSQATESEGEAFRMSEARRLASLWPAFMSASANAGYFRNVLRTIEHDVKNFRRVPFFRLPFFGQARKLTKIKFYRHIANLATHRKIRRAKD